MDRVRAGCLGVSIKWLDMGYCLVQHDTCVGTLKPGLGSGPVTACRSDYHCCI